MSCSCIFSEDAWDEVVKRCVVCQYNFDHHDQIQKKRKSSVQLRISVSLTKRNEIKKSCAII
jgi:hypothetical protein